MRLILANPHIHQYGKTVSNFITFQKTAIKYTYFLDNYIKNKNRDVAFFIDGTRSSFNEIGIRFNFLPKFSAYLELLLWMVINRVNPFRHKVYFDIRKLNFKNDVLFNCSFTTIDNYARNNNGMQFHYYDGVVVTHLTHYFCDAKAIHHYLKNIKNSFLVAENDLSKNEFFRHYFPDMENIYQLPFAYSARFTNKSPFESRQNKCFAVGTVFAPRYRDFIEYFGGGTPLHPMRDVIYNKKNEIKEFIDCYICSFESARNLKNISKDDSLPTKLAKKYLPFFLLSKILPNYKKEYFKFNIAEKYNQYKIFISPEEIVGLPSINAIEGMACGCAFIGIDDPMYDNIGFKAGVNYIAYKVNDLEDLINKIKYYFEHQQELKKIADNGCEFVRNNFSKEKIADVFWDDLEKLLNTFNEGNAEFYCSFKK